MRHPQHSQPLQQQPQQQQQQQQQAPAPQQHPQHSQPQQQQQQQQQPLLHESQNGFRPQRSCADHQFVLHQILTGRRLEKKDTYVLFVDTYKAFPTVWQDGLFHKLWEKGVRGKMFRVLHNLYQGANRVVSHDDVCLCY
jgi:Reverse transcriptase (RNA-dependent DNA polymerase)